MEYIEIINFFIEKINIKKVGEITKPNIGKIAINIIQNTEKGNIMIRGYPICSNKLETGSLDFEIKALLFFEKNGINVPNLIKNNGNVLKIEINNFIFIAYFMIEGFSLNQISLNSVVAGRIGAFLYNYLKISIKYQPEQDESPINSFEYIIQIANILEERLVELKLSEIWTNMKNNVIKNKDLVNNTPVGIVHGDFFYENLIQSKDNEIIGIIDFGDAYYGRIIHDIVIATMEGSVYLNGEWDMNCIFSILNYVKDFILDYNITFEQFYNTLKADCFRFSIYTICSNTENYKNNEYIKRYEYISKDEFKDELSKVYKSIKY